MANLESDRSNKWDQFFVELQSQGRYAFTFEELRSRFKSSEKTLLQGLYRYKTKKQIACKFRFILTPHSGILTPL